MPNKNKSSVFVTGAGGFIGANIVRHLLEENYSVHVINHRNEIPWRLRAIAHLISIHDADLTNSRKLNKALQESHPDYIIHLASYGAYPYQSELKKAIKVNIDGTKNLLEASQHIPYKCFINAGSSSEYGFKNKPMKENDFCEPVSYYAATKLSQTNICKIFAKLNNKPIVTVRLFSVYGPFEEPTRFIPVIMKALIDTNPIKLTPGRQRRDFIYIKDVTDALLHILKKKDLPQGEIYNLGTGIEYTNDEVVNTLLKVTNKETNIVKGSYPKRIWDTSHWVSNTSKTKTVLEWHPQYTLDKGLRETYSWFKMNSNLYK